MTILKLIIDELAGLFIDDGLMASGVLVWILLIGMGLHESILRPRLAAGLLILGLILMLMVSIMRAVRAKRS